MRIRLDHLTKIFPSRDKKSETVRAVHDFCFEVPDGKLVGLLGPSGCGKSTILNMLCGLEAPTEGTIHFDDTDVTHLPPEKRGVGMVFQNYALYPMMSVLKNIMFPLENLKGPEKLPKEEILKRAMDAAKIVQIEEYLQRKPRQLSGGQQQRVAIARALVKMPKVLLMDEPLSNLDARLRLQTREEIRRIQRETNITTIFVTHDQDEAMSISDCIVVMKDGEIQQTGAPQEVYDQPCNLFVSKFLGVPPITLLDGRIESGSLFIGDQAICQVGDVKDCPVTVGIRPEGFIPDPNGPLVCQIKEVEVMGRDISVVCQTPYALSESIRAIISSEQAVDRNDRDIRFSIKPGKLFAFDKETAVRLF